MLQYFLTGLAGVALGIVGMRVWLSQEGPKAAGDAVNAPREAGAAAPVIPSNASPRSRWLLLGAGGMVLAAAAVFTFRSAGNDGVASDAGPPGAQAAGGQNLGDVDSMIGALAARLEKNPNDGEGFRMLGWSYMMTGHPDKAIEPYKRALQLLPQNALVHSGYGEAMVGVAGGKVTPEAKAEFDRAIALDRADPRARYFQAMWLAQNGDPKQALDRWIDLSNSGAGDAPWQDDVHRQISATAAKLGVDVSARLKARPAGAAGSGLSGPNAAQVAEAAQMPPEQRQASIDQMVSGLAAKLKTNPDNPDGWVMLLRSRMVMKQQDQAAKDLVAARKALAANPDGLAKVNAAARDVGIPGA